MFVYGGKYTKNYGKKCKKCLFFLSQGYLFLQKWSNYQELCVSSRPENKVYDMNRHHFYSFLCATMILFPTLAGIPAAAQQTGKSQVQVGVVLPLKEKSARGSKMVEFYQGLLLAVDSMRHEGLSVEITAVHSGSTANDMDQLLLKRPLENCDVVFGPLDMAQLTALADYCDLRGMRLVVPFATEDTQLTGHPLYYMAAAPRSVVQREAAWYIKTQFPNANLIAVGTEEPNEEGRTFIQAVKDAVAEQGTYVRQLPAAGDDMAFEAAINPERKNILILDGSSMKALNIILPRLRDYHRQHPEIQLSLFGYPAWQTYTQQLLQDFYTFDTYVYTTFYRNPLSPRAHEFDSRFVRWFQRPPQNTFPRYAQVGFDLGYYFLRGLAIFGDNLEERHERVPALPYQNPYWFQQQGEKDGFVNTFVELVHYTTFQTIDLITRDR